MQREKEQEQVEQDVSMEENAGPLLINKLEVKSLQKFHRKVNAFIKS